MRPFSLHRAGSDKQSQAEEIIRRLLADGRRPEREVRQACRDAGIGISNYTNARANIKVETRKSTLDGGWILYFAESNMAPPILPLEGDNLPLRGG